METIKKKLKEFKLAGIYNSLKERIAYAKKESLSYIDFLSLILEIAIHKEIKEEGEVSTNISHYPKYKVMTEEENYKKFLVKTEKTGPYVKDIFLKIKKTFPKQWHRIVRGILSLKKKYSNETINLSCKRTLKYKAYSYRIVRNIYKEGLYNLPLE